MIALVKRSRRWHSAHTALFAIEHHFSYQQVLGQWRNAVRTIFLNDRHLKALSHQCGVLTAPWHRIQNIQFTYRPVQTTPTLCTLSTHCAIALVLFIPNCLNNLCYAHMRQFLSNDLFTEHIYVTHLLKQSITCNIKTTFYIVYKTPDFLTYCTILSCCKSYTLQ